MSADTEIDTAGTVHAETSNVDITEHASRDGEGELRFELNNRDEAVSIETRFGDGETRVAALARLSASETDQLADALGVKRDVTVERGRPEKQYHTAMILPGLVGGAAGGYGLATLSPGLLVSGVGAALALLVCVLLVGLLHGFIRGDVLGGGSV